MPASASATAVAAPMPVDAPVTTPTRSASGRDTSLPLGGQQRPERGAHLAGWLDERVAHRIGPAPCGVRLDDRAAVGEPHRALVDVEPVRGGREPGAGLEAVVVAHLVEILDVAAG